MELSSGIPSLLILCAISFDTAMCFVHTTATLEWPAGSYALPMTESGCPEDSGFTWHTGHRTEELENDHNRNKHSTNTHLRTKIGKPDITHYFCVKNSTEADKGKPKWPNGKYCIYKKGDFCPQDFHEGYVLWDDNNERNGSNRNSKGGQLPAGLYNQDTMIYFCCKTIGSAVKRISLPVNKPFYLLAFESTTCQEVQGAVYSLEYVVFDTENTNNRDARVFPYPYGAQLRDPTIYYCYYQECKWNLTQPSGAFSSPYFPNNYHDFQDCQWNITVPRGHVIRLQFGVFELESNPYSCGNGRCSCDYVEVKEESVTGDVTTLGRYCMTIVPLPIIQSSTNKMIVTFHSDHAISAKGFNASYTSVPAIKENRMTTTASTISSTEQSSSRTTSLSRTTQQSTVGTTRNNLPSTKFLSSTSDAIKVTNSTTTESSMETQSLSSTVLPKTTQGKLLERREFTSGKPTNSKAEEKSTGNTHGVQSSGDIEPLSRDIMGFPLKYIIIAGGSFVAVTLALSLLVCLLCKSRRRSRKKRAQQSNQFNFVTYSSVRESSGSSAPTSPINMYGDSSEMEELFFEDKQSDNPIYDKRLSGTKDQLTENPLYESYDSSSNNDSRTESRLYEQLL